MKVCTLVFPICLLNTVFLCRGYARWFDTSNSKGKTAGAEYWTTWSSCVVQNGSCGIGTQFRTHLCGTVNLTNKPCTKFQEKRNCSIPCPVAGNWTDWVEWGPCNTTCGNGTQRRFRSCTNPVPLHGGTNCTGENEQSRECQVPCPVDGSWTSWGNWADCYPSCGNGHRMRVRNCTNPAPKHKGKHCFGPGTEVQTCSLKPCPGDCDFESDLCEWRNTKSGDDFDWMRWRGATRSAQTGPYYDHTTTKGSYVYAEASWPRKKGDAAKLFSPPMTGIWCMRFFYSMYGAGMGDLQVFLHHENDLLESFVWGKYKDQGIGWRQANATVYGFPGRHFNISFVSRIGPMYMSDMALDDISFVRGTCHGEKLDFLYKNKTGNNVGDIAKKKGEPGTCHFDSLGRNLCGWVNEPVDDNIDWFLQSGSTHSKETGPSFDHSTGFNGTGKYLYIEASGRKRGWKAKLLSPRLCGKHCMQFYYHMNGKNIGSLNVYHRHGLGKDDKVWSVSGNQGDKWFEALVTFNGDCYKIVVEGSVVGGLYGDIAFDDVYITKGSCCALNNRMFDAGREGNCSFDEGFGHWEHKKTDVDFEWTLWNGSTPSLYTGPSSDFSGSGKYVFIESSEPQMIGDKAALVSKVIRGLQCMSFRYHMYGETVGSLTVYQFGNGIMRIPVWSRKGNLGDLWNHASITFFCNVTSYRIEIEAKVGGWRGDIAIDSIEFTPGKCPKSTIIVAAAAASKPSPTPTLINNSNGSCTFPGHFCSWRNAVDDNVDWVLHRGSTPTESTGPNGDYDKGGYYLYTEASLSKSGDTARLISEYMTGQLCMEFYYHMYIVGIGKLYVEKINKGKKSKSRIVWSKHGNQGQMWKRALIELQGTTYMIGIVSVRGKSYKGDVAIDTIKFSPGKCHGRKSKVTDPQLPNLPTSIFLLDNCDFDRGFCKWRNILKDDFDWSLRRGETPSGLTGPRRDHSGSGMYAYIETSAPRRPSDKARLMRYGSGEACMVFFYNMYGSGVGSLRVYQRNKGSEILLWKKDGSRGRQWWRAEVHIRDVSRYKIIIEGVRGRDYRGDIAIDDISFVNGDCSIPVRRHYK